MPGGSEVLQNHLLGAMPPEALQQWRPLMQSVPLHAGQTLHAPGDTPAAVYFPTTAIVSLLLAADANVETEFAVVGSEGMVGVSVLMGGGPTPVRAVVQTAGEAWRIGAAEVRPEFDRSGATLQLMLRYTQALITQMAQTAVCNRHHTVAQQLCRWLLMRLDRLPAQEMTMTQESIASLLGVRREGITGAARRLRVEGVVRYSRGHVQVLDRAALEQRACECYGVVSKAREAPG